MSEVALAALYRALSRRLSEPGKVWDDRAFPNLAPAGTARPYAIFSWSGGGEANRVIHRDANLTLVVKCVADTLAEAFEGAGQIAAALNDRGAHDLPDAPELALQADAPWRILTVTGEQDVHLVEMFADAAPIYHQGAKYRFDMEVISDE